ncbi:MAG: cbb3-type cytochrome oxidase assembly protein [Opitutales bacterium]|nr:cbb3-type cytochrome oxidase assembly protein [Opitutales bacterium]
MEFGGYIILGAVFAGLLFLGAAAVLWWAYRDGQFNDLAAGSRTIFDEEEEPEGEQTDFFPKRDPENPEKFPPRGE